MADSFTNSVRSATQGFGSGVRFFKTDTLISNTASTVDTTSIAPSPGIRNGILRIRTKTVDASATTQVNVTAGDGSTTVVVLPTTPATAAGQSIDINLDICLDISATTWTITFTVGGTTKTLTYDVELVGAY